MIANLHNIFLYYNTIRYLKPVQVFGRLWHKLYRPKIDKTHILPVRRIRSKWDSWLIKPTSFISPTRFRFLNKEYEIRTKDDWNNPDYEKLWLYHLHYFDYLNARADNDHRGYLEHLIKRWIRENPPCFGNGWEPYPISRRIVNWIKWFWKGNEEFKEAIASLAIQARYLSRRIEWHLLGNHVIANAKGLIFAGLFFEGEEADEWLYRGARIFIEQLKEQILLDGGHFERSPMYHAIVLEDVLDVLNAIKFVQKKDSNILKSLEDECSKIAPKMLSWLEIMTHPDGKFVLFNDCAFDGSNDFENLKSYAEWLGVQVDYTFARRLSEGSKFDVVHLKETGYIRVNWADIVAFVDVAPIGPDYQPGHGHADTLTFELSLGKERFVVDSGVSTYEMNSDRLMQRGTSAHNTVVVDGCDSSEVWGAFRVARRAYPLDLKIGFSEGPKPQVIISCGHDGYRRLRVGGIHRRKWCFTEDGLIIYDSIEGDFKNAAAYLHFHPDVKISYSKNTSMDKKVGTVKAFLGNKREFKIIVSRAKTSILDGSWHPEFGISRKSQCLRIEFQDREIETKILFKQS